VWEPVSPRGCCIGWCVPITGERLTSMRLCSGGENGQREWGNCVLACQEYHFHIAMCHAACERASPAETKHGSGTTGAADTGCGVLIVLLILCFMPRKFADSAAGKGCSKWVYQKFPLPRRKDQPRPRAPCRAGNRLAVATERHTRAELPSPPNKACFAWQSIR
jgi:hypothetical protein